MGTRKPAPRGDRGRGVVLLSGEPGDLAAEGACGSRAKGWTRATLVDTSAGTPARNQCLSGAQSVGRIVRTGTQRPGRGRQGKERTEAARNESRSSGSCCEHA